MWYDFPGSRLLASIPISMPRLFHSTKSNDTSWSQEVGGVGNVYFLIVDVMFISWSSGYLATLYMISEQHGANIRRE
jgi:hypothetical protein